MGKTSKTKVLAALYTLFSAVYLLTGTHNPTAHAMQKQPESEKSEVNRTSLPIALQLIWVSKPHEKRGPRGNQDTPHRFHIGGHEAHSRKLLNLIEERLGKTPHCTVSFLLDKAVLEDNLEFFKQHNLLNNPRVTITLLEDFLNTFEHFCMTAYGQSNPQEQKEKEEKEEKEKKESIRKNVLELREHLYNHALYGNPAVISDILRIMLSMDPYGEKEKSSGKKPYYLYLDVDQCIESECLRKFWDDPSMIERDSTIPLPASPKKPASDVDPIFFWGYEKPVSVIDWRVEQGNDLVGVHPMNTQRLEKRFFSCLPILNSCLKSMSYRFENPLRDAQNKLDQAPNSSFNEIWEQCANELEKRSKLVTDGGSFDRLSGNDITRITGPDGRFFSTFATEKAAVDFSYVSKKTCYLSWGSGIGFKGLVPFWYLMEKSKEIFTSFCKESSEEARKNILSTYTTTILPGYFSPEEKIAVLEKINTSEKFFLLKAIGSIYPLWSKLDDYATAKFYYRERPSSPAILSKAHAHITEEIERIKYIITFKSLPDAWLKSNAAESLLSLVNEMRTFFHVEDIKDHSDFIRSIEQRRAREGFLTREKVRQKMQSARLRKKTIG